MNISAKPQKVEITIGGGSVNVGFGNPVARDLVERDPYTGEYSVTPGDEEITLQTNSLRMTDNITVRAVPSNYGKISWNGSFLTVS